MTRVLVASFVDVDGLRAGIKAARGAGAALVDAFTPFPVEGLGLSLGASGTRTRTFMLIGGLAGAAIAYGVEAYSAIIAYPFDSGGRPLNSWPVFLLVPFEFGVLAAAVCGLVGFFVSTGLPRLNHPIFDVPGFERASQDRFLLALGLPKADARSGLEAHLAAAGATAIVEAEL